MPSATLSRRGLLAGAAAWCCSPPAPVRAAAADGDIGVAFVGDSMIDGIWGGMVRLVAREACLGPRIKLLRFGENGTGLTRPARFDWVERTRSIVATSKPTLVLVSLGLNDRQSIVEGRTRFELGKPEWRTRYGELVASLAKEAAQARAGGLWIGLPVLRDEVSQADAAEKNTIFAAAVHGLKDPKVRFVEPWRQTPEGPDTFQAYGPDLAGSRVQIRAGDGIHFTAAGYDVLARYVFAQALEQLRSQGVALTYPCGS